MPSLLFLAFPAGQCARSTRVVLFPLFLYRKRMLTAWLLALVSVCWASHTPHSAPRVPVRQLFVPPPFFASFAAASHSAGLAVREQARLLSRTALSTHNESAGRRQHFFSLVDAMSGADRAPSRAESRRKKKHLSLCGDGHCARGRGLNRYVAAGKRMKTEKKLEAEVLEEERAGVERALDAVSRASEAVKRFSAVTEKPTTTTAAVPTEDPGRLAALVAEELSHRAVLLTRQRKKIKVAERSGGFRIASPLAFVVPH